MTRHRAELFTLLGALVLLVVWEAGGRLAGPGAVVPPFSEIFTTVFLRGKDSRVFFTALAFTAEKAALGYLIGVGIGFGLAVLALLTPLMKPGIVRFCAIANATPIVALGPVLLATVERNNLPVAVAAFFVFFSVMVAVMAGFAETGKAHHDVLSALGASRVRRFIHLELASCVPTLTAGLKVAAPAAIVGAIFGEWFGLDRGIGPLLISSMQGYEAPALWGSTLLAGSLGMLLFLALSLVEKWAIARFR